MLMRMKTNSLYRYSRRYAVSDLLICRNCGGELPPRQLKRVMRGKYLASDLYACLDKRACRTRRIELNARAGLTNPVPYSS